MKPKVLVVDDELNIRKVLSAMLAREGYDVFTASEGGEAIRALKENPIHTIITDLKMPHIDGMELLDYVIRYHQDIPVIILTAFGTVDNAVEALKMGAFDYITKPFDQDEFKAVIAKAVGTYAFNQADIRGERDEEHGRFKIIGKSKEIETIYEIIQKVASTPSTVLITGESGTGKELIAKALHEQSGRKNKPLIKINCAAIPKTLIESELFGYEKGAFTGAVGSKPGRFELAHEGTLFLDEIGEIPNEMQVKLLRAIQEHEFERVGGIRTIKVDVRLVAATNQDLQKMVEESTFREDLFYRLNVVPIRLPPLRKRKDDIPLLVHHFIAKYNAKLNKNVMGLTPEAMAIFKQYHWPGNIRELENVMERIILFADGGTIDSKDLPEELSRTSPTEPAIQLSPDGSASLKDIVRATTEKLEKEIIINALKATKGNVTRAAQKLMISRKSLQNKMKEFNLRDKDYF